MLQLLENPFLVFHVIGALFIGHRDTSAIYLLTGSLDDLVRIAVVSDPPLVIREPRSGARLHLQCSSSSNIDPLVSDVSLLEHLVRVGLVQRH